MVDYRIELPGDAEESLRRRWSADDEHVSRVTTSFGDREVVNDTACSFCRAYYCYTTGEFSKPRPHCPFAEWALREGIYSACACLVWLDGVMPPRLYKLLEIDAGSIRWSAAHHSKVKILMRKFREQAADLITWVRAEADLAPVPQGRS